MNDSVREHPAVTEHWLYCGSPIVHAMIEDLLSAAISASGERDKAQCEVGDLRRQARTIRELRGLLDDRPKPLSVGGPRLSKLTKDMTPEELAEFRKAQAVKQ